MFFYILSAALNAVTSIVLGLFVYLKNTKEILNKIFAIFCFTVSAWASFYFLWLIFINTESTALFFGRVLNIAAIFIPITYFHFIAVFLNIYQKHKKLINFGYLLSFILFISGFTPLFVRGVEPELSFLWYPKPGVTFHIFTLTFFSYVIYSWYLMFKAIKTSTGITNLQRKYVLIGTLIGFIGGSTNFFPVYNIPIPPFGNGLVAVYVIFTAVAILKYRLFEIRVILTEFLISVMGIILLILPFLMPTATLKILTIFTFLLFCIFSYYLIKATHEESKRREEAEKLAIRERTLREETEKLAARERFLREEADKMTKDLKELNRILSQKFEEKAIELKTEKRIVEAFRETAEERARRIEELYRLTIGRELEMVKLKERIRELEEELKKKK